MRCDHEVMKLLKNAIEFLYLNVHLIPLENSFLELAPLSKKMLTTYWNFSFGIVFRAQVMSVCVFFFKKHFTEV